MLVKPGTRLALTRLALTRLNPTTTKELTIPNLPAAPAHSARFGIARAWNARARRGPAL